MDAQAALPAPLACATPQACWAGRASWRVLDLQWGSGQSFLATWLLWREDPNRPRLLHFVAFAPEAPQLDSLVSGAESTPAWQPLLDELKAHWLGLLPGFHRISLEQGHVLLTLCIGNTAELLKQQHFFADEVFLGDRTEGGHAAWDIWAVKALARCCRRGTQLTLRHREPTLVAILTQCGFVVSPRAELGAQNAVFDPHWTIKNSRTSSISAAISPGTCAVIGAGLAGASVAASLARRGWHVVVLDGGATPASGASGLPVGLLAPHGSADDCQLSRLSRAGVRLMLGETTRLLDEGTDWALTGSLEYRIDGSAGRPDHWPAEGAAWSQAMPLSELEPVPTVWHHRAAWIKPAALVRAWLSSPNITFQANAQVVSLKRAHDQWSVLDAQGQELTCADRVVFANATGALPLLKQLQVDHPQRQLQLNQLPPLYGVRGQVTWGHHAHTPQAVFPPTPINGAGSIIPHIPTSDGLTWFVGSSFQPDTQPAHSPEHNHWANFERLKQLKPDLATQLKPQFDSLKLHHWDNTRCVTVDRLPMVGPLGGPADADLWICAGMGSRGLTYSALCGELLAAQWGGEPLPIEFNLAQSFHALRAATKTK